MGHTTFGGPHRRRSSRRRCGSGPRKAEYRTPSMPDDIDHLTIDPTFVTIEITKKN
jgi:hypothetical protein